ncbi:MAG TPA: N-acetyl-gamma-glutamyl-phosphate reductase [Woeseiaceae bacterium]|nr:N-acetyl-gamma-glutamyl-phosphate reductase [Woeseiaceae bacterium]
MSRRIPAAVLGATGFVGGELLRLLSAHPTFELCAAVSDGRAGERIADVFPHLAGVYGERRFLPHEGWIDAQAGAPGLALFSAAPHGASARVVAAALDAAAARAIEVHAVDASADFRYPSAAAFEAVYGERHGAPELLSRFSSGLPEHVAGTPTPHVGHPGCFATAMLIACVPLLRAGLTDGRLFAAAVTGSTGSGRTPSAGTHHPERHGNLYAYKALAHRHVPEVTALAGQAAGLVPTLHFVPHSGPFARGIHLTLQATLADGVTAADVAAAFDASYAGAPFIEVIKGTPKLKDVVASNRACIGYAVAGGSVAVLCAIDNLVKGAAGGAVQWMNRLWALPETSGLVAPAPGWT